MEGVFHHICTERHSLFAPHTLRELKFKPGLNRIRGYDSLLYGTYRHLAAQHPYLIIIFEYLTRNRVYYVIACTCTCCNNPDSKVHGTNMAPIWGRQDPGGPHVGHMNLAIWEYMHCATQTYSHCLQTISLLQLEISLSRMTTTWFTKNPKHY